MLIGGVGMVWNIYPGAARRLSGAEVSNGSGYHSGDVKDVSQRRRFLDTGVLSSIRQVWAGKVSNERGKEVLEKGLSASLDCLFHQSFRSMND